MDELKTKIEGLVLRFELLSRCAESYENYANPDPDPVREAIIRARWKANKEVNAYHARILRKEILGWSP